MMVFSMLMSLVQLAAPDQMRGRVLSIYMMAFRGGMPLGSLATGYIANLTSAPITLALTGTILTILAGGVALRGPARREIGRI
jgi:predicted MFS family arabinose efflux permease